MVTRRMFIVSGIVASGGLAIGYALMPYTTLGRARKIAGKPDASMLTTWVRIGTDNNVTVIVPHSEMGQGVHTSLPMMLAEELDADWSLVRMEQAPADMAFANVGLARGFLRGDKSIPGVLSGPADFTFRKIAELMNLQLTGGSTSVRFTGVDGMRRTGAAARAMLIKAAAQKWSVPELEIVARQSKLTHASGKSATYGEMATAAAELDVPSNVQLKRKSDYTIVGKPIARFDIPSKVDGSARFGLDLRLPNMSFAVVAASPVFGGKLKSVDEAPAKSMRGVRQIVKLPDAVAVVADNTWRANQALMALKPEWDEGPNAATSSASIFAAMDAALDAGKFKSDFSIGNVDAALKDARKVIGHAYRVPYLAHATMETMNCTAHFDNGKLTIWGGFQDGLGARAKAAKFAGIPIDDVTLNHTAMGGGFGRRGSTLNYLQHAIGVARQVQGPVQLVFTREEDMTQDYYRHGSVSRMNAALDDKGKVTAWLHQFTEKFDPPEATMVNYDFANQASRYVKGLNPIPWGPWRSVDHTQMGFFIESFVDELAHEARQDPFEFRRAHLSAAPRHKAVLELAASMAGWDKRPAAGQARGIALREAFGTIVAQVAEVALTKDGRVRVLNIWSAVDPGEVVNPATFTAQIQGGAVYGLTAALYGEITIAKGRVMQRNFTEYDMVRMGDVPRHEVRFIESGAPTGGAGEPGTAPIAAAVGNAIFALTGQRIRELPFKNFDLKTGTRIAAL
ncbi:MAG: xanthine dehydrogenase family protein molybdopterin-binding subunit [Rhodocyclaceae bacterium]|nr:xanthine dehydrogenase family protein molybdopterin-binding subunit [Rhodocyclaceae bacterium]